MALSDEIESKRREIRTDGYAMSIGEWISLYEKDELDIHPEFQRFYRWSESQKTNLIESILLGIPIPPIFVSQRSDGVWDVVDGLQRLSTIFQLLGILKDEKKRPVDPLVLRATKYLPSLEGMRWSDPKRPKKMLPPETQLSLKRSKIAVSIILKESDENAKYDLFQRLNTGGSELSPQEVRNCLLVMVNKKTYEWLRQLAQYEPFKEVTALSDRPLEEAYDIEIVLRFMVLHSLPEKDLKNIGDVGDFLTDKMMELARDKSFPYKRNEKVFKETFDVLATTVGESAFKRFSTQKKRHEGGFLLSQFEVVGLGVAYNIRNETLISNADIPKKTRGIWSTKEYTDWAGSGIRASSRVPRLVPLGRGVFSKD
jgi:Protein of unknown function DUF262